MKFNLLPLVSALTVAANSTNLNAVDTPAASTRATLSSVRALELPREVARLIENSKGKDREERSLEIVRTAVELNRSSAPAIVGAAARVAPDLAAKFGAVAAELVSSMAAGIARAAAASAPAYATEIAAAVSKKQPDQSTQVAYEVAYVAPGKDAKIANRVVAEVAPAPDATSGADSVKALATSRSTQSVPLVPSVGSSSEVNLTQSVLTTPGQGRLYTRPNPRPPYTP